MAESKMNGIWIPEWVKNAVLGVLTTAVVGGFGMFYEMRSNIEALQIENQGLQEDIAKLEAAQEKQGDAAGKIRTDIASIKARLPLIERGVNDIQALLRSR